MNHEYPRNSLTSFRKKQALSFIMQSSQQQTQDTLPRSPTRSPHRKKQSIASPRVKKASVYNVKRMKSLQSSINNGQHFDSDFPKETVYPSIQAARDGINKWATTRNGTFSVILGKSYKSQMPGGESGTTRVDILCSRSGVCKGRGEGKRSTFTKKCNCPWRLCVVLLEGEEPFETVWMPLNIQTYPKSFQ